MRSEDLAPVLKAALLPLLRYHDYRAKGLEHVPVTGPAMLVFHHSLATYDALLLAVRIWEVTGRAPTGLGHDRLFEVPLLRRVTRELGIRPASPEAGRSMLAEGHLVGVAPGGMWEALRPSEERYQVRWERRRGFVRLAIEAQVPLVLAACPRADDLFDVKRHAVTDWVYDTFKWPLPMLRGRRGLPIPRRVPLVHYVAAPLHPPKLDPERLEEQIDALHAEATKTMEWLLERRD